MSEIVFRNINCLLLCTIFGFITFDSNPARAEGDKNAIRRIDLAPIALQQKRGGTEIGARILGGIPRRRGMAVAGVACQFTSAQGTGAPRPFLRRFHDRAELGFNGCTLRF